MCLDDAHEFLRPPKSRSYDAWHKAQLQQRLDQQYAAEQIEPDKEDEIVRYEDRRGE